MTKPVFLVDLDDTLFQTQRKMRDELGQIPWRVGALDRQNQCRSFMTEEQAMLVDWLLEQADLIPVTARGTEEISRVTINFTSWAVTTHGAVILTPAGLADAGWQDIVLSRLSSYSHRILDMQSGITRLLASRNIDGWARINHEYDGTPIYLVMKHRDSSRLDELYAVADQVAEQFSLEGFYVHRNGNNVAWLPTCIDKGQAVAYLLKQLRAERGVFPVIGLGDSLSDHHFLRLCTWFGMPAQSQFANRIQSLFS